MANILKNNNNVDPEEEKVKTTINGVDQATQDKAYNTPYAKSEEQQKLDSNSQTALDNYSNVVNKDKIVSDSTWDTLNSTFQKPAAVVEADKYIASQLTKIQSGKTSYSDQVKDIISQITNREKFSYDVDNDPLFQQALASAMNSGSQAMQDTIGQASALTGGYGSTYATSAGNQAYNSFIEDAYNNLPQYYQMALDAYKMEGEDLLNQYSVLSDADNTEYSRTLQAYDATYQHRNQMYNEAYTQFRDSKTDAYNSANLQIAEHGQLASDAYNYYNATSDYADKMYEREYTQWADEVNQAIQYAQMLNSDYWAQTNFDEGVRQYDQSFAEEQRQFDEKLAFDEKWTQYDYDWKTEESQKDREHQSSENALNRQHQSSENALNRQHQSNENALDRSHQSSESQKDRDFTASQNSLYKSGSGSSGGSDLKDATETQNKKALDAFNEGGYDGLNKYLNSLPSDVNTDAIAEYVGEYGELPLEQRTYTKTKDTINGLWGVDNNDIVVDDYGNVYRIDELPESIRKDLTGLKKDESWSKQNGKKITSSGKGGKF